MISIDIALAVLDIYAITELISEDTLVLEELAIADYTDAIIEVIIATAEADVSTEVETIPELSILVYTRADSELDELDTIVDVSIEPDADIEIIECD